MRHHFRWTPYWLPAISSPERGIFPSWSSRLLWFRDDFELWSSVEFIDALSFGYIFKALSSLESSLYSHVFVAVDVVEMPLLSCYQDCFLFYSKLSCKEFLSSFTIFPSTAFVTQVLLVFYLCILKLSFLRRIADYPQVFFFSFLYS